MVKNLSQDFNVRREQLVEFIEKQKDELKKSKIELKQLKKTQVKNQLPVWLKQITTIKGIPFAFIDIEDAQHDELKEIITLLQNKQSGFYFVVSKQDGRSLFLASLAPQFEKQLNLKNLAGWLKENHNFRGGGSKTMLQGGGGKFDTKIKEGLIEWIKSSL